MQSSKGMRKRKKAVCKVFPCRPPRFRMCNGTIAVRRSLRPSFCVHAQPVPRNDHPPDGIQPFPTVPRCHTGIHPTGTAVAGPFTANVFAPVRQDHHARRRDDFHAAENRFIPDDQRPVLRQRGGFSAKLEDFFNIRIAVFPFPCTAECRTAEEMRAEIFLQPCRRHLTAVAEGLHQPDRIFVPCCRLFGFPVITLGTFQVMH